MEKIGLYIHIPFCRSKCPYCDFYSSVKAGDMTDVYTDSVTEHIDLWRGRIDKNADTLYIGGGTPSLLGGSRIAKIIEAAKVFGDFDEVTVECNPSCVEDDFFKKIASAGANRISLGLQSAVDSERKKLGRLAGRKEIEKCIADAENAGIGNISVDVMLGIPCQTEKSFDETLGFCISCGADHISAYMLKLEPGTFFYKNKDRLNLPDDDFTADMYLKMVSQLSEAGFAQYEISNFAKEGYESRHNLKYWNCDEYLGIGPAAHSFINGKRFFYNRDTDAFIGGEEPVEDGAGGGFDEYMMFRLRLKEGIDFGEIRARYPDADTESIKKKADVFVKKGLAKLCGGRLSLTPEGFLLSNSVISSLI